MGINRKSTLVLFLSLALCVGLAAGCNRIFLRQQPVERTAMIAIAGSQGFIAQAQANHLAQCKATPALAFPCQAINDAVTAQNLTIDALETYCGWSVPPTSAQAASICVESPTAKAGLLNAVTNLQGILTNYKNLNGGKP